MDKRQLDFNIGNTSTGKDEWLTPPNILYALGEFDLDPCAPKNRPWATAKTHYTKSDNGLLLPWKGRVWLNPPFGAGVDKWLERLCGHGNGVALLPARTETNTYFTWVWEKAASVLFLAGRLHFYHGNGKKAGPAGWGCCLVAYGGDNTATLAGCGLRGKLISL